MNNEKTFPAHRLALTLLLPLTLAACGGEESSSVVSRTDAALHSPGDSGAQLTRFGFVALPAGIADARVCLDLAGTGVCAAQAALETRTRDDGSYHLHYQPKDAADAERFKTAPLLAEISGEHGSYTLSSPGGRSNHINPLTTLVYRQMLDSATQQAAERQIAQQLQIDVDAIYRPSTSSVATAAASLTHYALQNGLPTLAGGAPAAPDDTPQLRGLHFKDIHNYEYDVHMPEGSANAAGQTLWRPVYGGKINGNDRTQQDAAYTARFIDRFTSTGREEYLKKGALKLFSAENQFTPILLSREASAKGVHIGQKHSIPGYALETAVQQLDLSGLSMQTFFAHPASYRSALKNIVHTDAFKIEDPTLLADATFPQGSVLHIRLSTPVGNRNSVEYTQTRPTATSVRTSHTSSTWEKTLEHRGNDLNPSPQTYPLRALTLQYALNEHAWTAIKAALKLP